MIGVDEVIGIPRSGTLAEEPTAFLDGYAIRIDPKYANALFERGRTFADNYHGLVNRESLLRQGSLGGTLLRSRCALRRGGGLGRRASAGFRVACTDAAASRGGKVAYFARTAFAIFTALGVS
jgi:hypothetical protein